MRVLELSGDHYMMGLQHATLVRDLLPLIYVTVQERLDRLAPHGDAILHHERELRDTWEERARSTMEMIRGLAEGLGMEWKIFFRSTIARYLERCMELESHSEGCTVWGASGSVTRNGQPILAKNRDYRAAHAALQCLARARPARGYRYLYVTSAGSPAVFSSGINEVGLAVADTYVYSRDIGAGTARYSAEMEVLEHCADVPSALQYLQEMVHLGDGTLVLADRAGNLATFEAGHSVQGIVSGKDGQIVSTNHYVTPALRDLWVPYGPASRRGNSINRYTRTAAALKAARGEVEVSWAERYMATHDEPQHTICCHPDVDSQWSTISTALFLPAEAALRFASGPPCLAPFESHSVLPA